MENEWIKIKRDESGNATEEYLNDIFNNLPVVVCCFIGKDRSKLYYNMVGKYLDMQHNRNDIKTNVNYKYYLKIKKLDYGQRQDNNI